MSRDEHLRDFIVRLKWVIVGSGPQPRDEAESRAIIDWIGTAVDAWLLDPDGYEGAMLQGLSDGVFTIASIQDGTPAFSLTDYGRTMVDTMPHNLDRLTPDGIHG